MSVHISAKKGEIAKTVLQPGDPLRAKYIADNFLEDVKLVSKTRNIFYFTGLYKGKEISVIADGNDQESKFSTQKLQNTTFDFDLSPNGGTVLFTP